MHASLHPLTRRAAFASAPWQPLYRDHTSPVRSRSPAIWSSAASALLAITLLLIPAPALAQDDVQSLRNELADLRRRIAQIEAKLDERSARAAANNTQASVATPSPVLPLSVSTIGTTGRKDEQRRLAGVEPGELPLNSKPPVYWQVPGTATQFRVSGLIRMGAFKDLTDNLDSYKFRSGDIHPKGDPRRSQRGNIQAQLRLTRVSLDTATPTRLGLLETTLSVDFAGAEPKTYASEALQQNGYHARLMHAYGKLGPFPIFGIPSELLIGQTWSNFLDDPDSAESLDPSGPAGVPSERQPQIRYTMRWPEQALSLALENPIGDYQRPELTALGGSSFNNVSTTNRWPDLSVKYETEQSWGRAQLSGVLRMFAVDDGLGHRASALGYGLIAGGTINLRGQDRIGGQLWFGDGIGKYIPDEFGNANGFAVAGFGTESVRAQTQRSLGVSLWFRHFWSSDWRSNLAFGYARQIYAPFIIPAPDQASAIRTVQLNLIYVPIPMLDLGVELQYGLKTFRQELGLDDADALRLGFSSRIKFN